MAVTSLCIRSRGEGLISSPEKAEDLLPFSAGVKSPWKEKPEFCWLFLRLLAIASYSF